SPVAPLRGLECARAPRCEWSCDMLELREQEALMTVQSKSAPATTAALGAGLLYLDGARVPPGQAPPAVPTHGRHDGTSVFEGIRAYATDRGAAVFRLTDHSKRLLASAHIMGMRTALSVEQIDEAILNTIRANDRPGCYIRPLLWYGAESLGVNPT